MLSPLGRYSRVEGGVKLRGVQSDFAEFVHDHDVPNRPFASRWVQSGPVGQLPTTMRLVICPSGPRNTAFRSTEISNRNLGRNRFDEWTSLGKHDALSMGDPPHNIGAGGEPIQRVIGKSGVPPYWQPTFQKFPPGRRATTVAGRSASAGWPSGATHP